MNLSFALMGCMILAVGITMRSPFFFFLTSQVSHVEQQLPDFKKLFTELLFSETNLHVLRAMEELQVKIITYEHM